jgi:spore maturation protein CgeB
MKLVIFGLAVSSSWGNGHATLWRGLCKALGRRGHEITFYERDVPYYSSHRDLTELSEGKLVLYRDWEHIRQNARRDCDQADVAMVTSYCPDGLAATELVLESRAALKTFYDLDTPVTLNVLRSGQSVPYIGERGLGDFDLVLSYTGGKALDELRSQLGARQVAPLYGSVDPEVHCPAESNPTFRCDLSYLGTYAADRQDALERLFIEPARAVPNQKFLIGGAQYPEAFPWSNNIFFVRHIAPANHPAFYCSSRLTLNVTRGAMAEMGYCPSGRLFEAAACGVPLLSDCWEGLDQFFTPEREILVVRTSQDVVDALQVGPDVLARLGSEARERVMAEHTAGHRAIDFERVIENCKGGGNEKSDECLGNHTGSRSRHAHSAAGFF